MPSNYDIIDENGSRGQSSAPVASVKDVIETVSRQNSPEQQAQTGIQQQQFSEDYMQPEVDPLKDTGKLAGKVAGEAAKAVGGTIAKVGGGFVEEFLKTIQPKTLHEAVQMDAMVAANAANPAAMETVAGQKPDAIIGVQDQLAKSIDTFSQMAAERGLTNTTQGTQDQEYNARIADMTGQNPNPKSATKEGGPGLLSNILYYGSGGAIKSPGMTEALAEGQSRGAARGAMGADLQKGYLTSQAPLGTFEKEQLAQQERLRMSEIGIQQQQTAKGRAEVGLATMFPGTKWIKPLQPASVQDYMEGTDPGSLNVAARMNRPVSKGAPAEMKGKLEALRSRAPQGATHFSPSMGYLDAKGNPIRQQKKGK